MYLKVLREAESNYLDQHCRRIETFTFRTATKIGDNCQSEPVDRLFPNTASVPESTFGLLSEKSCVNRQKKKKKVGFYGDVAGPKDHEPAHMERP